MNKHDKHESDQRYFSHHYESIRDVPMSKSKLAAGIDITLDDDQSTIIGVARLETNRFGRKVFRGYWLGDNTPIKEKRWDRDFNSVRDVERYMRAMHKHKKDIY